MGWPSSLAVGVLTGLVAMVGAGWVAALVAYWYRMSSFEGASGYFLVGMALVGLLAGLVIGLVTSRLVAHAAHPGFLTALGLSLGVVAGSLLVIGATARLLADVPPRLDGEELTLQIELRWPEGRDPSVLPDSTEWLVRLGSVRGGRMRVSVEGPLWREDARLEDGRWIVPGAAEVFTSRGTRLLEVLPTGLVPTGFAVPLPRRPGPKQLAWSDWLPRIAAGDADPSTGFRYRFRVVPRSRPVRTESLGPFEIRTIASGFSSEQESDGRSVWIAFARFEILHGGNPVLIERPEEAGEAGAPVDAVATVGSESALLVYVMDYETGGRCTLVDEEPTGSLRIVPVSSCPAGLRPVPITNEPAVFAAARDRHPRQGRLDRRSFSTPGLYLLHGALFDTRDRSIRTFTPDQRSVIERIPPLGGSPDGHSFVRLAFEEDRPTLVVFDIDRDSSSVVPIDGARMRYGDIDQIDPAWVTHHFAWQRGPDGHDRLVERAAFDPFPWRGTLTMDAGGYREYQLRPAREGLREALISFLESEFAAERLPPEGYEYARQVRIDSAVVFVAWFEDQREVGLWMDRGTDSRLVADVAERFDAALRSGEYDALFGE